MSIDDMPSIIMHADKPIASSANHREAHRIAQIFQQTLTYNQSCSGLLVNFEIHQLFFNNLRKLFLSFTIDAAKIFNFGPIAIIQKKKTDSYTANYSEYLK